MDEVVNLSMVMIWLWYVLGFSIVTAIIMIVVNNKYDNFILKVFPSLVLISWLVLLWFM